jgi:hypothetical protein
MLRMTITQQDLSDAKTVIDAAVDRDELDAPETAALYGSLFHAAQSAGLVFDLGETVIRRAIAAPTPKRATRKRVTKAPAKSIES